MVVCGIGLQPSAKFWPFDRDSLRLQAPDHPVGGPFCICRPRVASIWNWCKAERCQGAVRASGSHPFASRRSRRLWIGAVMKAAGFCSSPPGGASAFKHAWFEGELETRDGVRRLPPGWIDDPTLHHLPLVARHVWRLVQIDRMTIPYRLSEIDHTVGGMVREVETLPRVGWARPSTSTAISR